MTPPPTRPRVALLGMMLEANAFAPVTTRADFLAGCYLAGEAMLTEAAQPNPAMPAEMTAFIQAMDAAGEWEPVPILLTAAEPGGPVEQAFFEEVLAAMRDGLQAAGPLDGVYFAQHGAMVATGSEDPDGELFAMARAVVGPRVPILATLDLHANISQAMVDATDVLIGYRTNPHVDQVERGREAARHFHAIWGGARPATAFLRLPLVGVQTSLLTKAGPYAELMQHGTARADADPAILNVSVIGSFSYADLPKQGLAMIVTTDGDEAKARRLCSELAGMAWENRRRFARDFTPLEAAVAEAKAAGEGTAAPVLIADVADNPGGGARSNTTWLLQALVEAGVRNALLGNFWDPALVREAQAAGVGATLTARFNSEETHEFSTPYEAEATVLALTEGEFVGRRGIVAGRTVRIGPTAALQVGGVAVVVTSLRKQCADPVYFEAHGLTPVAAACVVVKSRGHFRAGFDECFPDERILEVDVPGLTSNRLDTFTYHNRPQPAFPWEPDAVWTPPDWAKGT